MDSSFAINQLLLRYKLPVEKNLLYSYEELKNIQIDTELISALVQVFEDEKSCNEKEFEKFPLEIIIDYIRRTHRYYLTKNLFEIEQSISILSRNYSTNHPLLYILTDFFIDYRIDLTRHIHEEETGLLPYINYLLHAFKTGIHLSEYYFQKKDYSIDFFIENHHDTEEKLTEVRRCILNYNPPPMNQTPYRILLTQLNTFEKDLAVHAFIEDKILIPRAEELEKKLHQLFLFKIRMN